MAPPAAFLLATMLVKLSTIKLKFRCGALTGHGPPRTCGGSLMPRLFSGLRTDEDADSPSSGPALLTSRTATHPIRGAVCYADHALSSETGRWRPPRCDGLPDLSVSPECPLRFGAGKSCPSWPVRSNRTRVSKTQRPSLQGADHNSSDEFKRHAVHRIKVRECPVREVAKAGRA